MTTSCVLNAPRCVTIVPRVRLHGSRGGVFVDHRPPRDPGDPPHITSKRSLTSIQTVHTHTHAFTHRRFYTRTLLHTDTFTHKRFYKQTLLHTDPFKQRSFYTQKLLHADPFTHRRFYTHTLLHTDAFTHRHFYTQTLSHTEAF